MVLAQKYQPAGEEWITKWYSMDLVTNTGGHNASAAHDWLDEGTNGKITDASASTPKGLQTLKQIEVVNLPDNNGGELKWQVVTIDPVNSHNCGNLDNAEWYGIIVIKSPSKRETTMHPTHDDYAHIWINGEKVYDNPEWTTGATIVTHPTKVTLQKGENVLLFRLGESGGDDYINLHFEATDNDLKIVPTMDDKFFEYISMPVEPSGKLAKAWGDIKQR
jgi:hypothetical protein